MSNDVTILLLGSPEPGFRARARLHYAALGYPFLMLDEDLPSQTGDRCARLLADILAQVGTPFVTLSFDSDFLLGRALAEAVEQLAREPAASLAQGYALGYRAGHQQVEYYRIGKAFSPAHDDTALDRFERYARAGQQAWRGTVRVSALREALRDLPEELPFQAWLVALSCALLEQGPTVQLHLTGVICHVREEHASAVEREEQLNHTVRLLRHWDATRRGRFADEQGFAILDHLVRGSYGSGDAQLVFTSRWTSVLDDPERLFEPRQFVELPYYNASLFSRLSRLELLLHAWPAGEAHLRAVEGTWVRQRDLLIEHPNDTAESLKERYWQALGLGLFNPQVCRLLLSALTDESERHSARELTEWLVRLDTVSGVDVPAWLEASPSGQLLRAIAAATPDRAQSEQVLEYLVGHRPGQIAFVVLDTDDDDAALQATFDNLLASGLKDFKLVILKGGTPPMITTPRDTLHFIQVTDANLVGHLNQALRQLDSEWTLLMSAGDEFARGGLLRLLVELSGRPGCDAICANEIQRRADGRLFSVVRPGADIDLLRSRPDLMSRHWLLRRETVLALGGFSDAYRQALEFDLLLRLIERNGPGGLAHMDEYLVIGHQPSSAMTADAKAALERHLSALGYRAQVNESKDGRFFIDFRHSTTPQVSIVLAAGENLDRLQACLTTILQRTRYPRYEVLVACQPGAADGVAACLGGLRSHGARVRAMASDDVVSPGELIDMAATRAHGEYLVLLSNRCSVLTPAWIEGLMNEAQRPEVGVVGCHMRDGSGAFSHAGYELLEGQRVSASWLGMSGEGEARAVGLGVVRGVRAVSADCLMIRKAVFESSGGLGAHADGGIDLCLRVAQSGLSVVTTPQASMLNASVPVLDERERSALAARWPDAFQQRVVVDGRLAIDHSRDAAVQGQALLEWLPQSA